MKHKIVVEGAGHLSLAPDCDVIYLNHQIYGISDLISAADPDIEQLHYDIQWAFGSKSDRFAEEKQWYMESTGRKFPKIYRIKFTVETEELSDEEAEKYWIENRK